MKVNARNITQVYGRGNERLSGDVNWDALVGYFEKGTKVVTGLIQTGKQLLGPTQKAQQQAVTGGSPAAYSFGQPATALPSWLPMALGAGALGIVALVMLRR